MLAWRQHSADVVALLFSRGCTALSIARLTAMSGAAWVAIVASLPSSNDFDAFGLSSSGALVGMRIASDGSTSAGSPIALPALDESCKWSAAAAVSHGAMLAAATCTAPAPGIFLVDTRTGALITSAAVPTPASRVWIGAGWADVLDDGMPCGMLIRDDATMLMVHLLPSGALVVGKTTALEANPAYAWKTAAVGGWLLSGDYRSGLLALRAYNESLSGSEFAVNVLLYGAPSALEIRRQAIEGTLGQQGLTSILNLSTAHFNASLMKAQLLTTYTNTHNFELCHSHDYQSFITLLNATRGWAVAGRQFRMWAELLPPSEAIGDKCQVPPDLPSTPFNETALFGSAGYLDYPAWGELLGRLAALYPHLVALQMDDFTHDVRPPAGIFTPSLLARTTANLRAHAPHMSFLPVVYYSEGSAPVASLWPDLILVMDAPLFYFRNQREGAGPCAATPCWPYWGPATLPLPRGTNASRTGGCLAGPCAEPTATNVLVELDEIAKWLPSGRRILTGFYATGHSHLGTPSASYVRALPQLIMSHAAVAGVMSFTMLAPCGPRASPASCTGSGGKETWLLDLCAKGCAIADSYAVVSGRRAAELL